MSKPYEYESLSKLSVSQSQTVDKIFDTHDF